MTRSIVDKYEFMTERMGITLENMFRKSDETTAECILYDDVQQSLRKSGLEEVNKNALSKYFAYIDLDHVADYCYVDNKGNVYSRSYSNVSYDDVKKSGFQKYLEGDYSRTKWFWAKDSLFGTDNYALFIGRYVRSLDYAHEPGMMFFKMEEGFLNEITGISPELEEEASVGIIAEAGQLCLSAAPDDFGEKGNVPDYIIERLAEVQGEGMVLEGEKIKGGVLSVYHDTDSGLSVFSFVPNRILNQGLIPVFVVLGTIYLVVIAVAVILSIYFLPQVYKADPDDIKETMTEFDGHNFDQYNRAAHDIQSWMRSAGPTIRCSATIHRLLDEIKELRSGSCAQRS